MLEAIEKLLILQDCDRKILRVRDELARVGPEREQLRGMASGTQGALDAARNEVKHAESERKRLELEVESRKQQIEKYSLQQFQTKKNEEYRALAKEIETCKAAIVTLEDQQIVFMEQIEIAQRRVAEANKAAAETRKTVDSRIADIDTREGNLSRDVAGLESKREELAGAVEEGVRSKYERLLRHKGSNVVVGIQHGVCGGCHMQLNRHVVVACQAAQEIVTCSNCGRILYFTADMDVAVAG